MRFLIGLFLLGAVVKGQHGTNNSCFPDTVGRLVRLSSYVGTDSSEKIATLSPVDRDYQLVTFQPPPTFGTVLPTQMWRIHQHVETNSTMHNEHLQIWQNVRVNDTLSAKFCISASGARHGGVALTAPCVANHPSQFFQISCQACVPNRQAQNCTLEIMKPERLCLSFQRGPVAALGRWETCDGTQLLRLGQF